MKRFGRLTAVACRYQLIAKYTQNSLSKDVFERPTSTGSGYFAFLGKLSL